MIKMTLSDELRLYLEEIGCDVTGFADIRGIAKEARQNFDYGILIALAYSREAMEENKDGRAEKYYEEYNSINKRLPELAEKTARFLMQKGYLALPKAATMVVQDGDYRTSLPHKTVATLAGVGWIGKCATLVTRQFGSALRLVVVLTDAPLECGEPVTESECAPGCTVCADICPGKAPLGGSWRVGVDRDLFFNAHACRPAARAHAEAALGVEETLCGLCISSCPFTMQGLRYK